MSAQMLTSLLSELFPFSILGIPVSFFSYDDEDDDMDDDFDDFGEDDDYSFDDDDEDGEDDGSDPKWFDNEEEWDKY